MWLISSVRHSSKEDTQIKPLNFKKKLKVTSSTSHKLNPFWHPIVWPSILVLVISSLVRETGEDWDIFHICCNSCKPTWDSFLEFCMKKGNYKYFNSSQTFRSYIRYRLSRKLFFGPVPIPSDSKMSGRIGTVCGEEWDMYSKIKISNYLKLK